MGSRETLELLTHLEKDAWAVETNEPKAKWSPLDIAVYFNNRKLCVGVQVVESGYFGSCF